MKISVIFLMVLITSILSGQEKYASYKSSYFKNSIYDIRIDFKSAVDYSLSIDMQSKQGKDNGGIILKSELHQSFLDTLNKAKSKFTEWLKVAKENKIKDVTKQIELDITVPVCYFKAGNVKHFHSNSNFVFIFNMTNGLPLLTLFTQRLKSFNNNSITHEGFILGFTTVKEIDDFIDLVSVKNVKGYIENPKVKDLFKD